MNAIHSPSADQAGEPSSASDVLVPAFAVRFVARPPLGSMT
jgi:hypothetical protein